MKKILLLLTVVIAFTSCSDDDSGAPASDVFMKATVEGNTLDVTGIGTPDDTRGTNSYYQVSDETLYLTGNNGDIIIGFEIGNFSKSTGTFELGGVDSGSVGSYTDNNDKENPVIYYSQSGTLDITSFDGTTMSGTFTFKAYNKTLAQEITVTSGSFKVPFTEI